MVDLERMAKRILFREGTMEKKPIVQRFEITELRGNVRLSVEDIRFILNDGWFGSNAVWDVRDLDEEEE